MSGHNAATAASTAPRRTTAPSRLAPSAARVGLGVGGASIETSRGAYRELAMRIFESGIISLALWCGLYALQLLPGPTRQETGAGAMILVGIAAGVLRARRWLLLALTATAITVAVVVFTTISNDIAVWWVRTDPLPAAPPDAVVVLSAGLKSDTTISSEALDHLIAGLELAREGRIKTLITTSTEEEFPAGMVDSKTDQARIVRLLGGGVQTEWIQVAGGNTTRDEAVSAAAALQPRAMRRIAVVTSPMHTRRACAVFERVGFEVTCVAARLRGAGTLPLSDSPDDRLAVFGGWIYEAAAMTKYRLYGWLPRGTW